MSEVAQTAPLRINLGCGARWAPAWSNMDGGPWAKRQWLRCLRVLRAFPLVERFLPARLRRYPRDIVVWDMTHLPLPYPANSASVIFSQYAFEYLGRDEMQACLEDCTRILIPGGIIRLCQTDVAGMVASYLAESEAGPSGRAVDRTQRLLECVSGSEHMKLSVRLLHRGGHQQVFDAPSLEWMLTEAGFTDIRFVKIYEGECPDLRMLEVEYVPVPLVRVEARTPRMV